jgi:hypothetical protein
LESKIIEGQKADKGIFHIKKKIREEPSKHFRVDEQDVLWFDNRLVVPKVRELKNKIIDEEVLHCVSTIPSVPPPCLSYQSPPPPAPSLTLAPALLPHLAPAPPALAHAQVNNYIQF